MFHDPVSKPIDSPFLRHEELFKYKRRELLGRNRFNVSGSDMNASRVTRLGRSPRPRRAKKITQRDTSRDNPSADKAFRRSRASGTLSKASFSLPPLHGHAVALENNGPNGALDIVRTSLPPRSSPPPLSLGIERMNDRSAFTDTSIPLRFIRRIIRDRAPSARAFSAYGRGSELHFTLLELQFSSFKVLPHYHITYPVS